MSSSDRDIAINESIDPRRKERERERERESGETVLFVVVGSIV